MTNGFLVILSNVFIYFIDILATSYSPPVTSSSLRRGELRALGRSEKEISKKCLGATKVPDFGRRRHQLPGIIGRNGAGKTTLLKMLNGLIKPDAGSITMRGRVGALIALGVGFNPILTVPVSKAK